MTPQPGIVVLDGVEPGPDLVGGKGAALARLVSAGMPVPPTAVVTTAAYRAFTAHSSIAGLASRIHAGERVDDREVDATFLSHPIDPDLATEIHDLATKVGDGGPVAVRSSATVEDLAASSFAGQYRSLINVDPHDLGALLDAVRLVWASLWHRAPSAYRRALGIDATHAAMAAVVMAMVPARTAGVVFTTDPGGRQDLARVEAVSGLGEALVSGAETPDAWLVPRRGPIDDRVPADAVEALRLSLEIERLSGVPQDVEWTWDGEEVWVVQSRPITTAVSNGDGFDSAEDYHELTTAGIGEMVPGVLPPLRWEMCSLLLEEGFRRLLDDLDVPAGGVEEPAPLIRRVRGRAALDFHQLRGVAEALPGGMVEELETQYFGTGPSLARRRRPRHGMRGALHDLRVLAARRRAVESSAVVVAAVDRRSETGPDLLRRSDADLLRYRRRLIDLAARGTAAEIAVAAAGAAAYRRLEGLLERHVGAVEAARQVQLITAGAGAGSDPASRSDASAAVFAGPTWRELEREPPAGTAEQSRRREALGELETRLTADPHWRTTRILTGQVIDVRLHVIRRAVADAVALLDRREQTKDAVMIIGGETRRVQLELGGRLREAGLLDDEEDVELLTERELVAAVAGRGPDHTELARRRTCLRRYQAMAPLPLRFVGSPEAIPGALPRGDRLDGWAASPGRYTGTARVVTDPDGHLEPGEILVAAATDASWSPLFVHAGAIVVERGGPLSHAAILARELGVPAVLNVAGATQALDGRAVTVDGDTGTVVVIEPRREEVDGEVTP